MFGKSSSSDGCTLGLTAVQGQDTDARPPKTPTQTGLLRPAPALCIAVLMLLSLRCASPDGVAVVVADVEAVTAIAQPAAGEEHEGVLRQASEDPVGLLELALQRYDDRVTDYAGTFVLQERIDGKLNQQMTNDFKFRTSPFSLMMHRVKGGGRLSKLVYVAGLNDGKMIVEPAGLLRALAASVMLDPLGSTARASSLNPITDFGLRCTISRVLDAYRAAQARGQLNSECLGLGELDGRQVLTLSKSSATEKTVIDMEVETLLPLRIRRYTTEGEIIAMYRYKDLRFNCGLADSDFTPEGNGF